MGASLTDDVVAIGRLNAAYADVITRRALTELTDLMLPDCGIHLDLVSAPVRTLVGPVALAGMLAGAMERFDHFTFVIRNSVVDVDAEAGVATGRMFISEIRHDRATNEWEETHGMYEDDLRRVEGRWWFAQRHYRSLARNAAEPVVLGLPATLRHGRRPGH
ncbi:nuclear transport factor 2 family protein [Candidatus Neomicrothrix sp.]|jgi:hypothetical protein|uniref:nuclear transport factor 2 family protein n=1 Tax=Candidatus Neomicrothrix sp. TaxID=2719034 RepID=UPI001B778A3E|nr:nuclear transport factor 2 family protein [Candidatus Microthrix sp.]MBK7018646.1 nuclear transport factor 2 family protein [Candidatus Microthrix sp.]MBL0205770.1 nuclear transport factor 2 family protein [Candidatus Microthrix sp.]MBP6133567.1 nuclear transport factor 2 family protein [Candidatus Microthrix sp.]MBP6148576.1 nuclear transport factor 2 family protein [Candidatus Microthrix sp.]MBP7985978.1 nuclear transport factor 2 family protein [Candidatus Microthrix sp.]